MGALPQRLSVLGLLFFLFVSGAQAVERDGQGLTLAALRELALAQVNAARQEHGLAPLRREDALDEAAQRHAEDMTARGYYGHVSPEGETVFDRYRKAGGSRWRKVAENIARCENCARALQVPPQSRTIVAHFQQGWMKSPGHRENILDPGLNRFGFGLAARDGVIHAVQTFAGPGAPNGGTREESGAAAPLPPADQSALARDLLNAERKQAEAPPLSLDAELSRALRETLRAQLTGAKAEERIDMERLLAAARQAGEGRWRELALVAGACGGCGTAPAAADIRNFYQDWLETADHRRRLLAPRFDRLGFALVADGEGRKLAAAVLARGP